MKLFNRLNIKDPTPWVRATLTSAVVVGTGLVALNEAVSRQQGLQFLDPMIIAVATALISFANAALVALNPKDPSWGVGSDPVPAPVEAPPVLDGDIHPDDTHHVNTPPDPDVVVVPEPEPLFDPVVLVVDEVLNEVPLVAVDDTEFAPGFVPVEPDLSQVADAVIIDYSEEG